MIGNLQGNLITRAALWKSKIEIFRFSQSKKTIAGSYWCVGRILIGFEAKKMALMVLKQVFSKKMSNFISAIFH